MSDAISHQSSENPIIVQKLAIITEGRSSSVFHACEHCAWTRAGDLIVGFAPVAADRGTQQVDAAYDELDATQEVKQAERWNIVLVVEVHGPPQEARACARSLEHDLSRSRKLARIAGAPLPRLFADIQRPTLSPANLDTDVVRKVLDEMASGELRSALEVLLTDRRPSADVERLIELLGSDGGLS